jgi:hypothetical protein
VKIGWKLVKMGGKLVKIGWKLVKMGWKLGGNQGIDVTYEEKIKNTPPQNWPVSAPANK